MMGKVGDTHTSRNVGMYVQRQDKQKMNYPRQAFAEMLPENHRSRSLGEFRHTSTTGCQRHAPSPPAHHTMPPPVGFRRLLSSLYSLPAQAG